MDRSLCWNGTEQDWQLEGGWSLNPYPESAYSIHYEGTSLHKIRFRRTEAGIPVAYERGVTVCIDRITGNVASYSISWYKVVFAPANQIISKKAAADIFFNKVQPYLYISSEVSNPKLVYALDDSYTLSAVDGKLQENDKYPPTKLDKTLTDNITIELTINSKTAYINGKAYQLPAPAQLVNKLTYIPAKFTVQALGATVAWEAAYRLPFINTAADIPRIETEQSPLLLRMKAQHNGDAKYLK
ncbi:MAG: copper amine oxidase N-terminal domain-containing protein [Gorillibacterium sp.]|nr:copper amine oxidase N-terminal domain-containing protein [Gorillibacterium sp.]